jgi:hypothetical protein
MFQTKKLEYLDFGGVAGILHLTQVRCFGESTKSCTEIERYGFDDYL